MTNKIIKFTKGSLLNSLAEVNYEFEDVYQVSLITNNPTVGLTPGSFFCVNKGECEEVPRKFEKKEVVVEYTGVSGRENKTFPNEYKAMKFFVTKKLRGKNPIIVEGTVCDQN